MPCAPEHIGRSSGRHEKPRGLRPVMGVGLAARVDPTVVPQSSTPPQPTAIDDPNLRLHGPKATWLPRSRCDPLSRVPWRDILGRTSRSCGNDRNQRRFVISSQARDGRLLLLNRRQHRSQVPGIRPAHGGSGGTEDLSLCEDHFSILAICADNGHRFVFRVKQPPL